MRNLKKLLALVLAMMMAFSLMLTANAANPVRDYPDKDQADEAFEEAIDVLTGMKVYSGDNGNFKPADNITRAEVAALIYRLATGDVTDAQANLYAEYGNFPDVPHDAWYAGYVGYCANAGYIKGRSNGNFDPSGNVTGYEALAMILRAIGYDKNGEFTGSTWQTEVSALSQQLGILTNVKTTQYGGTLYLPARRDVIADLLFQADAFVPMVIYTPAFGYQPYGMVNGGSGGSLIGSENQPNPTLGNRIFGLTYTGGTDEKASDGKGRPILLGNEQTGESKGKSVMGYSGSQDTKADGTALGSKISFSPYTWKTQYDVSTAGAVKPASNNPANDATLGDNVTYTLSTGIDLIGHKMKLWYDDGNGSASLTNKRVFAYFDEADTTVVEAETADLTGDPTDAITDLGEAIVAAGYKLNKDLTDTEVAVFNNSFGRFGSGDDFADTNAVGNGQQDNNPDDIKSPVNLYKIIDNNGDKKIDAIIALNIESSQITESNNVNRVPTIGMPVIDSGDTGTGVTDSNDPQLETMFITTGTGGLPGTLDDGLNTHEVPTGGVITGVIAQDALVGNSVKALGSYEMGIHITGTTPREVSTNEQIAINQAANKNDMERAYFLLSEVTAPVSGTVVAYNTAAGTVTLDNGTVLERSKFYDTVVITNPAGGSMSNAVSNTQAPISAIPQAWLWEDSATSDANYKLKWVEGYANVTYKFYLDYEGKYLGAERTFGSTFLYGTYQDYSQATSTSTFNYYLTGVTLDGEIETVQLKKYWDAAGIASSTGTAKEITATDELGVPFRDTATTSGGNRNGLGENPYVGFAIMGDTADRDTTDPATNSREYVNNMARLGVKYADGDDAFVGTINVDKDDVALGAVETVAGERKYFTEATKFILVSGFGTDSVKAEVFDGISKLLGNSAQVSLNMDTSPISLRDGWSNSGQADANTMTYFKESPYTYAQSGDTDKKIDVIIMPKEAVTWAGGSGLYYVGNPTAKLTNSWGEDAWKYDLYLDGELQQVWLTNNPSSSTWGADTNGNDNDYNLCKDTFYNLKDTGNKANDGEPIYTAGNYTSGVWTGGRGITPNNDPTRGTGPIDTNQFTMTTVRYSAITRDAQTATFSTYTGTPGGDSNIQLYRVAEAKVVNTNTGAKSTAGAFANQQKSQSGEIWPGITSLPTLNEAGSINPVTGRALRVSATVDPDNPLVVTCIYVCYEQDWT